MSGSLVVLVGFGAFLWSLGGCVWMFGYLGSGLGRVAVADLSIFNARAAWMFHGRAYAGGRFACLFRNASLGTP